MGYIGQAPTKVPLTSADITDGTIALADMAANSIDSDQYVDGSIDLAHMSSESVDEDNLHISNSGSNGEFLSKQSGDAGGLTWASAGGGLVHLQSQTASTSASIAFSSTYITSTYKTYVIYGSDILSATDGAIFEVHYSEDNGSSYLTSAYTFMIDGSDHAGNQFGAASGSASESQLTVAIDSSTMGAEGNMGMHFVLNDPTSANNCSHHASMGSYRDNADTLIVSSTVVGHNEGTNAVNNIKFEMSSGTISTGFFSLFGVSTG